MFRLRLKCVSRTQLMLTAMIELTLSQYEYNLMALGQMHAMYSRVKSRNCVANTKKYIALELNAYYHDKTGLESCYSYACTNV